MGVVIINSFSRNLAIKERRQTRRLKKKKKKQRVKGEDLSASEGRKSQSGGNEWQQNKRHLISTVDPCKVWSILPAKVSL